MMLSHGMIGAKKFTTLDTVNVGTGITLSNGNLTSAMNSTVGGIARSLMSLTVGSSPNRYYEFTTTSTYPCIGFVTSSAALSSTYVGNDAFGWGQYSDGKIYHSGTGTAFGATWTTGDVISILINGTTGAVTIWKNGVSQGVGFTVSGTVFAAVGDYTVVTGLGTFNFGASAWIYTPTAGYIGWYS